MPDISPLFYVNVGPKGTFQASGNVRTDPSQVDAIFQYLRQQQIKKLALHFHGGLVPEGAGMGVAQKMISVYQDAHCHPVSFVYETGFLETIKTNLTTIHQTTLFRKVLFWTLKKAGKHLGVDLGGKGSGAEMDDQTIDAQLQLDAPFDGLRLTGPGARGAAALPSLADLPAKENLIASELLAEMMDDRDFLALLHSPSPDGWTAGATRRLEPEAEQGGKGAGLMQAFIAVAQIAVRVLDRTIRHRDHGFYPTVVEEILRALYLDDFGAWVWDGMKDQAKAMWEPNGGLSGDARHAGRYFLEGLQALQQETGLEVDLVGHSTGSIAICHLLRAAEQVGGLHVRNILLLAPAARVELFHDEVITRKNQFERVRIFSMTDEQECQDRLVDGIYTRSLLYFISGVLERGEDVPLIGLARDILNNDLYKDAPLPAIRAAFGPPSDDWLVLAPTANQAGPGRRSTSTSHGGFDDDPETRRSLTSILAG